MRRARDRPRPGGLGRTCRRTFALGYGNLAPDITRCLASLDVAAKALESGDLAKASVAAVLLKLPGDQIALETSSSAGPLPGTPEASLSTAEWTWPVEYSSRFTGGGANQLVIQANPPGGMQRWTIKIPPQQSTHDNSDYNTVRVYVRKPSSAN